MAAGVMTLLWSPALGGRQQTHSIVGADGTIKNYPDSLEGTVTIDGTEISVIATGVDANGYPTGFVPATRADAQKLEDLGVNVSRDSGVIDTAPLRNEEVDGSDGTGTKDHSGKFPDNPGQTDHILDPSEPGHLADTPENRERIEGSISEENHLGTDQWGNEWYAGEETDGHKLGRQCGTVQFRMQKQMQKVNIEHLTLRLV